MRAEATVTLDVCEDIRAGRDPFGRNKVPALADLYSPALQAAGYWLFVAGLLLTSVATALGHETFVRAGCVVLLFSVAVFVVNIGKILAHLVRPRIGPLVFKSTIQGNA